jgi:hypothetical protein
VKLEKFLQYVTHHSEAMTQWLFLAVLFLAGAIVARGLFGKKGEEPDGTKVAFSGTGAVRSAGDGDAIATAPAPELQAALIKIMEQTAKLESLSLGDLKPASPQEANTQVEALKRDIQAKETEIARLKAEGEARPSVETGPDGETGNLSARIKELEAKLAEYEILEDDIADLSLYREENSRLREEIEKYKSGGAAAPAPVPTSSQDPSVATPGSEDIVAEFAHAVGQEATPADGEPVLTEVQIPDTGNPMADFENTVKLEKQIKPSPAPESAGHEPAAPTPAAAEEKDDLFAEFTEDKPEGKEDELDANLDTDKMMAEMASLVNHEPGGNALEEDVDTEKMVLEMTGLNTKT